MDWKDIGSKIGAAAPALGSLLGGPAGAAVGAIVATALGSKADPASVASALDANPEALARLAELQSAERVRLQESPSRPNKTAFSLSRTSSRPSLASSPQRRQTGIRREGLPRNRMISFVRLLHSPF